MNSIAWLIYYMSLAQSCFVVHYVLYYDKIPMKYYLQMSQNSTFPYMVHLNQPLNLPIHKNFTTPLSPVEMSDIKKVETIYRYGGLYLDNDQYINYQCVKSQICNLTGLYFLDWTYLKERWKKSVPLSFIYASDPFNETLKRSLQGLNQSIDSQDISRTVYFSGPSHMQQYRDGMDFIKIPRKCEKHRADKTWVDQKDKKQIKLQQQIDRRIVSKYNAEQKKAKNKFVELWKTNTVIYPSRFNMSVQHQINEDFNHVEMLDKINVEIKVIKFSTNENNRRLLQQFMSKYSNQNLTTSGQASLNLRNQEVNKLPQVKQGYEQSKNIKMRIPTPTSASTLNNMPAPVNTSQSKKSEIHEQALKPAKIIVESYPIYPIFIQYFYLVIVVILLFVVLAGFVCHRYTRCCKNNNYQENDNKQLKKKAGKSNKISQDEGNNESDRSNVEFSSMDLVNEVYSKQVCQSRLQKNEDNELGM